MAERHPPDRVWLQYSEKMLSEDDRRSAEAHVRRCARCAARAGAIGSARTACTEALGPGKSRSARRALAAAAIAIAAASAAAWQLTGPHIHVEAARRGELPSSLERAAAALHERAVHDGVDPGSRSASAREIRAFLKDRGAPFPNLAIDRPAEDGAAFVPVGVSLENAAGAPASAVYYRVRGAPVTLLVARANELGDPPERSLTGLRVTHRVRNGLHTYAWTQAGQSYAIVSPLRAREACRICHTDARFQKALIRQVP